MTSYIFRTNLVIAVAGLAEHEPALTIRYTVTPEWPPSLEDPGSPAEVTMTSISVKALSGFDCEVEGWLWAYLEQDDDLHAELLAHAAADDEYRRDQAADARREEMQLERHP